MCRHGRAYIAGLVLCLVIFFWAALAMARVKSPWSDEGWFACPAYNLAFHGSMGTPVLEPTGHYLMAELKGIQQHTYVVPPLYILFMAACFKALGFGLMAMRVASAVWGGIAIAATFWLIRKLVNSKAAALAAALLSLDFTFIWSAADGRMDMMCIALTLTGLSTYINLREKSLTAALVLSNCAFAAAFMTHPNAFLGVIVLAFFVWHYDRKRLRIAYLLLAAIPYAIALGAWSVYILQDPSDFRIQFFANAAGRGNVRAQGLYQPWTALWREVLIRYMTHYGFNPIWVPGYTPKWFALIPSIYAAAAIGLSAKPKTAEVRVVLTMLLAYFLAMTFLIGFKTQMYLAYIVPLYDAVLAIWVLGLWRAGRNQRMAAGAVLAVFAAINLQMLWLKYTENSYEHEYRPSIAALQSYIREGKSVYASAAAGFDIDYRDFTDDGRLGYYTHKMADVILMDRTYNLWQDMFQLDEQPVYRYISNMLALQYRVVNVSGRYKLFVRKGVATAQ